MANDYPVFLRTCADTYSSDCTTVCSGCALQCSLHGWTCFRIVLYLLTELLHRMGLLNYSILYRYCINTEHQCSTVQYPRNPRILYGQLFQQYLEAVVFSFCAVSTVLYTVSGAVGPVLRSLEYGTCSHTYSSSTGLIQILASESPQAHGFLEGLLDLPHFDGLRAVRQRL